MFNGFCKQVCQLFSSVNIFYSIVIIKVPLPHIEVSHFDVFRPVVIFRVLVNLVALVLLMYSTGVFLAKQF